MVPASAGRGLARGFSPQASAAPARQHVSRRATVASSTLIPKIVRVNLLRRHPIALALIALLLLSALVPLPPLLDAVSGGPPADVDLVRPTLYTLLAPISNVLDALTFLSLGRAKPFLVTWVPALALWGLLQRGSLRRRLGGGAGAARGDPARRCSSPAAAPRPPAPGGRLDAHCHRLPRAHRAVARRSPRLDTRGPRRLACGPGVRGVVRHRSQRGVQRRGRHPFPPAAPGRVGRVQPARRRPLRPRARLARRAPRRDPRPCRPLFPALHPTRPRDSAA